MSDVAKITNLTEFEKVEEHYQTLLQDLTKAPASDLRECRSKIESFIEKHLIKVNKAAGKDKSK